jgi:cation-transporting ATPase E
MPSVVNEGRRVINNIERSASLFLVKNIFSFALTLTALIFALGYPITPSQLSLFNMTIIGIPSFILAMEPNTNLVRGRFLKNVLYRALPAGLTDYLAMLGAILVSVHFSIPAVEMSTMTTIIIGGIGFMMLYRISRPLNSIRIALILSMMALFAIGALLFTDLFTLSPLSLTAIEATVLILAASVPVMTVFAMITRKFELRGKTHHRADKHRQ